MNIISFSTLRLDSRTECGLEEMDCGGQQCQHNNSTRLVQCFRSLGSEQAAYCASRLAARAGQNICQRAYKSRPSVDAIDDASRTLSCWTSTTTFPPFAHIIAFFFFFFFFFFLSLVSRPTEKMFLLSAGGKESQSPVAYSSADLPSRTLSLKKKVKKVKTLCHSFRSSAWDRCRRDSALFFLAHVVR